MESRQAKIYIFFSFFLEKSFFYQKSRLPLQPIRRNGRAGLMHRS